MKARHALLSLLAAPAFAAVVCLAGCSSDDADKKAADPAQDKAKDKKSESSVSKKTSGFFNSIDSALDKSRVKSDNADMYRFKNNDTVIFHKERRSDGLLDKNDSVSGYR